MRRSRNSIAQNRENHFANARITELNISIVWQETASGFGRIAIAPEALIYRAGHKT